MQSLQPFIWWFAGGLEHPYHSLSACMHRDWFWISITVMLDLMVAVGYVLIAYHWSVNEQELPPSPARAALHTMRNIFAFCGVCGYIFIPVKMFWPAWRLYDMFMVGLVFYTWRYALNARNLKVIYTAIGQSKRLAEDLAKSQDESKRKSFFLNAISHDLRTPLNGILLHANLAELQLNSGDPQAIQKSIGEIKGSIHNTVEMLEGLLEYARMDSVDEVVSLAEVNLSELIGDVISSHEPIAERKSLYLTSAAGDGIILKTDRLRLERVLNNLVSNAIKFTRDGSVTIDVDSSTQLTRISVVDTGIGIAPEHQGRLFEEFFQVQNYERDRQKGFGLGLSICQRLVHQLQGQIVLESAVGKGSRFILVLPGCVAATPSAIQRVNPDSEPVLAESPAGAFGGG